MRTYNILLVIIAASILDVSTRTGLVYASSDVIGAACVQGTSAAALALERGPNMIKELVLLT